MLEQVEKRFVDHLNSDSLPLTYVALINDKPIGMCSLRKNDGIKPDLMPWLGSLVVDPNFQHQGVGKYLIENVKVKAKKMGYNNLYLFTFDPTLPSGMSV